MTNHPLRLLLRRPPYQGLVGLVLSPNHPPLLLLLLLVRRRRRRPPEKVVV